MIRGRKRRGLAIALVVGGGLVGLAFAAELLLREACPFPLETIATADASTRVLGVDGSVLRVTMTADQEKRLPIAFEQVSPHVVHALVAGEDRRFYEHSGVDARAVVRAALGNFWAGRTVSGASTITMQVVRLLQPRPRTMRSKVIEAFRARQLETLLSKQEILELYLGLAPFGGVLRGIEAAAQAWFGKSSTELAAHESATLIALLPAPTLRAPDRSPKALLRLRDSLLRGMCREGFLSDRQLASALARPLQARRHGWPWRAPHWCDAVLREGGGEVRTTSLDPRWQRRVESAASADPHREVDGLAIVVVERGTGDVRALVGSRDWTEQPFNAATARRAAGSTLKPFLYAAAFQAGIAGPWSSLDDSPAEVGDSVANFDHRYDGRVRAAEALASSRNIPAVNLLRRLGVDRFRATLGSLGLDVGARRWDPSAALGTLTVSPLGLARAYARFFAEESSDRVISAEVTGHVFAALAERPLPGLVDDRSVAWKTGTSSGHHDAWCVAVTPESVVVVWRGDLSGQSDPSLVGVTTAAPLASEIVGRVRELERQRG